MNSIISTLLSTTLSQSVTFLGIAIAAVGLIKVVAAFMRIPQGFDEDILQLYSGGCLIFGSFLAMVFFVLLKTYVDLPEIIRVVGAAIILFVFQLISLRFAAKHKQVTKDKKVA